ncbi:MAG: Trm112 family protein [Marinilabilia sp.]
MRRGFADKLCCPMDKQDLALHIFHLEEVENEEDEILEGLLICPKCKRYYPVIYGIPIMTPDEYREPALEAPTLERWGLSLDQSQPHRLSIEGVRNMGPSQLDE